MGSAHYGLVALVLLAYHYGSLAQISTFSGGAPGGLFGSGGESDGELSAGDNSGSAGESNGYLPPLGSSSSSNVPAFSQPPQKPQDSGNDIAPSNNPQQFAFPPIQPQVGCAAALICVEEQFCNLIGTISETPVVLTKEQLLRRVPLVDCKNPDNGIIGKCCRDPNYVDPWPAGNLPANYSGGFDDQGFPTFLNLSKNKPKKPVVKPSESFQQPFQSNKKQPIKFASPQPQTFSSVNQISTHLQPQPSFQNTKVTADQFKPFQDSANTQQQPRPFQPQNFERPDAFKQPQQFQQPDLFKQPQQSHKAQFSKNSQYPDQPNQYHQFQRPQKTQQPEETGRFQLQQPQPFQQSYKPDLSQQLLPVESQRPQQYNNQPVKLSQSPQVEKTFNFPSLPALQDIPNQITNQLSNLNPFRPQQPTEKPQVTNIINNADNILPVNLPSTTKKPGFFQNFPNLPSFPGFGKGHDSSPTNESPVIISPHTPGAQCGIINQVYLNSLLLNSVKQTGVRSDVEVAFGEIPWQAMILSNTEKKLLCSGVIVAPNLILTAANCVYGLNPDEVSIKAGEWKLGYDLKHEEPLPFEIVQVDSIVPHPNYQPGSPSFDTALLFLQSPIKLDLHVDTICIGDAPAVTPQRKCISTGWGKTILQIHAAGALMHKINVDVLSNAQCRQRLQVAESSIDIDDSLVCAKAHKQNNNLCQVDIGGPLACDRGDGNYELVGVYNQDTGCLPTNQVATFALVDTKWVKSMIESPAAPPSQAIYGSKATPIENQRAQETPSRLHYHPSQPDVPCDCQQGTLPSGANQYLPPV
ncbi:PREDICTED: serine proteinase stubble-like [Ceratosolen solmsi marchali]|uniref:Serine proteinase stubble-like n=1 Tax=Ceratosolen solmsi marchali TaxID=326594 RepID=A0AAJ7DX79_9HYME|nr:PREDICTED: serine proteinase stubble-like [Ceratosolen solmsi marchali]